MSDISDVNEALGVAKNVTEYAFAEAVLIGTTISDLESTSVTFEQNKDEYEKIAGQLDSLKVYYEGLAKMLSDNKIPSYNEAVAEEKSGKMAEEAKVLKEQSELMMNHMSKMIELAKELHTRAKELHTNAGTLETQAKAVIERP